MNSRLLVGLLIVFLAFVLLVCICLCGGGALLWQGQQGEGPFAALLATSTPTATPTATPTPTPTPTPMPTATPTPPPTPKPTTRVTVSLDLAQPVALENKQLRLTILELTKDGDSRGTAKSGFAGISIQSQYRSSNYLLVVHVRGENFTSDDLGLSVRALSATDPDTGKSLEGAGACAVGGDLCAPGLRMKLPPSAPKQLELIFTVPNGLKQIAFELLTVEKWEK